MVFILFFSISAQANILFDSVGQRALHFYLQGERVNAEYCDGVDFASVSAGAARVAGVVGSLGSASTALSENGFSGEDIDRNLHAIKDHLLQTLNSLKDSGFVDTFISTETANIGDLKAQDLFQSYSEDAASSAVSLVQPDEIDQEVERFLLMVR